MRALGLLSMLACMFLPVHARPQDAPPADTQVPVNAIDQGAAAENRWLTKQHEVAIKALTVGLLGGGGAVGAFSYVFKGKKYLALQKQLDCIKEVLGEDDAGWFDRMVALIKESAHWETIDADHLGKKHTPLMDRYRKCTKESGLLALIRNNPSKLARILSRGADSWEAEEDQRIREWDAQKEQEKKDGLKVPLKPGGRNDPPPVEEELAQQPTTERANGQPNPRSHFPDTNGNSRQRSYTPPVLRPKVAQNHNVAPSSTDDSHLSDDRRRKKVNYQSNLNFVPGDPPTVAAGTLGMVEQKVKQLGSQAPTYLQEGLKTGKVLTQEMSNGIKKQANNLFSGDKAGGKPFGLPFALPGGGGGGQMLSIPKFVPR
ncbi:MAG: hypothetical protein M1823_002384 [Watsoniomyces obsoletus]|nr:MAG: hypothetical protein M1823_002384 [Watsoniomyces obsoletus]